MIIGNLSNAKRYSCNHPLFAKAFEYIQPQDLVTIEPGQYKIESDGLKAIVSNKPGKTIEESTTKFECHDKHIDIQLCIKGKE